jgi:hypothetical protein
MAISSAQDDDEELTAWLEEFHRLVAEAEERVVAGHLRAALASLNAIPSVHKRVAEECQRRLERPDRDYPSRIPAVGQYL